MWDSIKDRVGETPVDFVDLEAHFRTGVEVDTGPKHKGPKTVSLISAKRTQSINIFLKSSRMTPDQLAALVWALDDKRISPEFAEILLSSIPEPEEMVRACPWLLLQALH